jgi:hypothetical protein
MRLPGILLLLLTFSVFSVFGASPAWLQGDGLAPLTYRSVLLNSLHFFPDLLPEKTWLAVTRSELAVAQAHYAARPDVARQERMVFSAEQVKGRNAQGAEALAPFLKEEVLKRAAAAPRTLVASHALPPFQYDASSGKLVPAGGAPRQFSLLTVPPPSALTGLPDQAAAMAIYAVAENQRDDATEEGFRDVIEAIRNQQGGVSAASMIALDRRVMSDGIVLPQTSAQAVLDAGKRHEGLGMTANVVFTVEGAAQGPAKRVLLARLVHVTITDPDSRIIASYQAGDFPAADAKPAPPAPPPVAPAFDIVGISLGMPAAEVDRILQAHMPVGSIFRRERGRDVGPQPVAFDALKVYMSEDTREVVLVYFDQTTAHTVSAVRRWVALDPASTQESVRARLIAKYGKPDQTLPNAGGWAWGRASGCQIFGDTLLRVENLDRVRGMPRTDQAFRQALQKPVDIRRFGYKPGNVTRCGLAVTSRIENGGLVTTLFDQRATAQQFYPEPPPKPVKPAARPAKPAAKPAPPRAP